MTELTIRRPVPGDAESLAALHVSVWRHAYRGLIEQALLDRLDPDKSLQRWQETIAQQEAGTLAHAVLIADSGAGPVGIIEAGPARDDDAPRQTEVLSLNVAPRWHGKGVAPPLFDAAVGDKDAYLWVLRGNERAIGFYRKLGFELDGTEHYDEAWRCFDLRMQRPAPGV